MIFESENSGPGVVPQTHDVDLVLVITLRVISLWPNINGKQIDRRLQVRLFLDEH